MRRFKSITLLFVIGIIMFPWKLLEFCVAHPLGHGQHHHEPGKPTPCELRRQFKGTAYWPPMDCHELSVKTDNYQVPDKFQIKPTFQTLAIAAALFQLAEIDFPQVHFSLPPEPKCRSAPLVSVNTLRGPPLI